MTVETWETITGSENLLILATRPGDESRDCGGLIAQSCRRGRPPFVLVLTDGVGPGSSAAQAAMCERRTRLAVRHLGLPSGRLLMAGLFDGHVPADGRDFDSVVEGVTTIMWARDCNVICAPSCARGSADRRAADRIARAVAARSGVGLLHCLLPEGNSATVPGWRLDITADLAAKCLALGAHQMPIADLAPREVFCRGRVSMSESG